MRAVVAGLIVVALLAAGGTAFFVKRFLSSQKQAQTEAVVEAPSSKTLVLVAAGGLPAGKTITSSDIRWQEWSESGTHKTFVVSRTKDKKLEEEFIDAIVRRGIAEGTPITAKMVAKRDGPGFLAVALDPGMLAFAVGVTAVTGAAGFILPGDHVDVILTHDVTKSLPKSMAETTIASGALSKFAAETVVTGVRVLAIDQKFDDFQDKAAVAKTVTLELTPKQAQTLAVASSMGGLSLALRSLASEGENENTKVADDEAEPFTSDIEASPALSRTLRRAIAELEAKSAADKKPPTSAPRGEAVKVKVYRGGQGTTQEFSGR